MGQAHYLNMKSEVIQERLNRFKGSDAAREATLVQLFSSAGCQSANLTEQPVHGRHEPNVICILPGSTPATIVVGAHFDHVADGEGVVDNWSGASLLPSLFQSLDHSPRTHTFVFVGFTGEEDGLIGSAYYVKHATPEQLANVEAMLNLDTLGLGPTKIWVSRSDHGLVNRLVGIARSMNLQITGMDIDGFGQSDEESFIAKNVCTITVHSITAETAHVLHSRWDDMSAIHFTDYYDTYRLLAGYLAFLDTVQTATPGGCKVKPL
jgi:hypothetical protein